MHVTQPLGRAGLLSSAEARAGASCLFPILAGAVAPWLMWDVAGRLSAGDVAAATLASVVIMLRIMCRPRAEPRQDVWRGPQHRPGLALVLCGGLAASLMAPGASAFALIDAVGLPRVIGTVRSYDFSALEAAGATLGLAGVFGDARVAPDGTARLTTAHGHGAAPRILPWRLIPGGICIGADRCLTLDPASGRLRLGGENVGRVMTVEQRDN